MIEPCFLERGLQMKSVVRLLPLLPVFTSPGCQPSQADIHNQAFESLISAERAFAATSVATDTRTAFLANFAPNGVVFDDGPVNARSVWEQRPAGGPILSWGPEIADVSVAGDMGYTSGPYEVRMTPDEDAVAWGHFISVRRFRLYVRRGAGPAGVGGREYPAARFLLSNLEAGCELKLARGC